MFSTFSDKIFSDKFLLSNGGDLFDENKNNFGEVILLPCDWKVTIVKAIVNILELPFGPYLGGPSCQSVYNLCNCRKKKQGHEIESVMGSFPQTAKNCLSLFGFYSPRKYKALSSSSYQCLHEASLGSWPSVPSHFHLQNRIDYLIFLHVTCLWW